MRGLRDDPREQMAAVRVFVRRTEILTLTFCWRTDFGFSLSPSLTHAMPHLYLTDAQIGRLLSALEQTSPEEGDLDLRSYLGSRGRAADNHPHTNEGFREGALDANLAGESHLYGERS